MVVAVLRCHLPSVNNFGRSSAFALDGSRHNPDSCKTGSFDGTMPQLRVILVRDTIESHEVQNAIHFSRSRLNLPVILELLWQPAPTLRHCQSRAMEIPWTNANPGSPSSSTSRRSSLECIERCHPLQKCTRCHIHIHMTSQNTMGYSKCSGFFGSAKVLQTSKCRSSNELSVDQTVSPPSEKLVCSFAASHLGKLICSSRFSSSLAWCSNERGLNADIHWRLQASPKMGGFPQVSTAHLLVPTCVAEFDASTGPDVFFYFQLPKVFNP